MRMMLNRFVAAVPVLATTLLTAVLVSCNSPSAPEAGTPPFVPADGATDPAALTPGAPGVAQQPGTATADSLDLAYLISPGRAGQLRLGMREDQIKKLFDPTLLRATTYSDNGRQLPAYELRDAGKPDAPATVLHLIGNSATGYRLRRIRIYDPQYRTAEGIGVGSPFGAARQNLGLTKVRNTPAGFAAVSGAAKIAWVIDPNSLPDKHPEEMNSTDIPPAARITGVLLYQ
jgi:hypothetical protein